VLTTEIYVDVLTTNYKTKLFKIQINFKKIYVHTIGKTMIQVIYKRFVRKKVMGFVKNVNLCFVFSIDLEIYIFVNLFKIKSNCWNKFKLNKIKNKKYN